MVMLMEGPYQIEVLVQTVEYNIDKLLCIVLLVALELLKHRCELLDEPLRIKSRPSGCPHLPSKSAEYICKSSTKTEFSFDVNVSEIP
jgi:hypothetical protein